MDYKNCSIQELIIASQKNNLDAFEIIIEKYQNLAFRFAFFLTGNKNIAKTITKECFIHFFNELKSYNVSRPIESWLLASITTKIKGENQQIEAKEESTLNQRLQQFMKTFKEIPIEIKEAIIATKLLRLTNTQAAEYLNIPEKDLISRLNTGILKLLQNKL